MSETTTAAGPGVARSSRALTWLYIALLVYLLLLGVGIIGDGFKWISGGVEGAAAMTDRAAGIVEEAVGGGQLKGIATGTVATVLVQSSSTTTSLLVPLAAAGMLTTRQVFPFTMGANIGTCITALLAATAVSGPSQVLALQIALVHLLYNVSGVIVFVFTPWLKHLPVRSAEWLGDRAERNRGWAFAYIAVVFFLLPGAVFSGELYAGGPRQEILAGEEVFDETRHLELAIE